ncbi:TetR/AcrR family transcriptional regulator [Streptomyces griseorubiginosus]|uniref:TetR/AcrR family transcriptional regulator n=1 Tax=Streptomyces griseorubiginosus TaxID=67304 RepID=UPI001AD729F5|nr:TetR/AcrR family transcriptional regulator [Streptomyces griseorubiginosus]MBO4258741.1 TetR family transcriptional regulator [Streptomyces griseorubiginosus]
MAPEADQPLSTPTGEPAWKQRAVERSTQAAKRRAEQRVERFLDAAQAIMAEKGTTDFTVQEVVDRSKQSLRSFYQHFDGKHELLLALFEDAMSKSAEELRALAAQQSDPLDRVRVVVQELFEISRPDLSARQRPLFSDFAMRLLVSHPAEMRVANAPLLALFTELMEELEEADLLRSGFTARRGAALTMQTVMFNAQSSGQEGAHPITAEEIWDYCANGFTMDAPTS